MDTHGEKTGIFAKKGMWIGIGVGIFILIGFILPTPQSLIEVLEKYGYVEKMIEWEIAHNVEQASAGTQNVSSNIGLVDSAAGQAGQAAEAVLASARDLSHQSELLEEQVNSFLRHVRSACQV